MAVPDFQSLMRPLLAALEDGEDRAIGSIRATLAAEFELGQEDLDERIPSGRVTTFQNRVGWAATYLYRTKLVDRPKRATYRITQRGRETLGAHSERVDLKILSAFPEFEEFRQAKASAAGENSEASPPTDNDAQTPEERIVGAYRELRSALAGDLLDRVLEQTPEFFEQLVLDVLQAMGYGGSREDAAQRLGRSGDEGVDGVIREDRLGLDLIYVQAKRWTNVVGRPEIQRFFGALHGRRATKGVFITTSGFSREALEYAEGVSPRVILVHGQELAQLMIEHGVGVTVSRKYEIKRLDLDYFAMDDEEAPTLRVTNSPDAPNAVT
jgi:restriction system protein